MMLTDPSDDLTAQNDFVDSLVGLAALGRIVRALAVADRSAPAPAPEADDFVHLLLGIASLGAAVERMGSTSPPAAGFGRRSPRLPGGLLR
jgi:hypothetical protein